MYYGDIRLGEVVDIKFTTRRFSTGAPFTLAGTPVISAYPGNSLTQLTAGITLTVDFDGVTGLHNVRVVASGANGYLTATNYALVITTGTVDAVSVVGEVIGSFSIEARSALIPTVAARTLDVSAAGEAGVDWANVGSPTASVTLSGTAVGTATALGVGAVSAAAVATGAFDADALATDAVNEIRDAVWAQVMTEATAPPSVTGTLKAAMEWLLALARNKITQTATIQTLRNDADAATIATAAVSDDGTTFTRAEWV